MRFEKSFNILEHGTHEFWQLLLPAGNDLLNSPQPNGKWTPLQHLVHLNKSERSLIILLYKSLKNNASLPGNAFKINLRRFYFMFRLSSGIRFKAPEVTHPHTEIFDIGNVKEDFEKTRMQLAVILKDLTPDQARKFWGPHPYLKEMRVPDLLKFMSFHQEHHFKQIRKILEKAD